MVAVAHTTAQIIRLRHLAQADGRIPAGIVADAPAFQELVARRRRALEEWLQKAADAPAAVSPHREPMPQTE